MSNVSLPVKLKSWVWRADFILNKGLYLLAIPIFLYFFIFC